MTVRRGRSFDPGTLLEPANNAITATAFRGTADKVQRY